MEPLSQKDLEALRKSRGVALSVVTPIALFTMSAFYLIMCIVGLRLTSRLAEAGGYTFGDVWTYWISGIDLSKSYSGIIIKALERLSMSAFQVGLAFCFLIFGISVVIQNRRNRRIIDFIENYEKK